MSGAVSTRGVEHVGMVVRDTVALAGWFGAVFGAEIVSRSSDEPPILFLRFGGGSLVELVPGTPPATTPSDHVHLSLSVDELKIAIEGLKGAGIEIEKGPFDAYEGSPVVFFRDPEGNLLQVVERRSALRQPS